MPAIWAGGVAFTEGHLNSGEAVVEGYTQENVLHKVLYLQAHGNGIQKKKKKKTGLDADGDGETGMRTLTRELRKHVHIHSRECTSLVI
jgi:hypothetical protein